MRYQCILYPPSARPPATAKLLVSMRASPQRGLKTFINRINGLQTFLNVWPKLLEDEKICSFGASLGGPKEPSDLGIDIQAKK